MDLFHASMMFNIIFATAPDLRLSVPPLHGSFSVRSVRRAMAAAPSASPPGHRCCGPWPKRRSGSAGPSRGGCCSSRRSSAAWESHWGMENHGLP